VGKKGKRQGWPDITLYDQRIERAYDTLELVSPPSESVEDEDYRRVKRKVTRRRELVDLRAEAEGDAA
jgi:hypothetical protein